MTFEGTSKMQKCIYILQESNSTTLKCFFPPQMTKIVQANKIQFEDFMLWHRLRHYSVENFNYTCTVIPCDAQILDLCAAEVVMNLSRFAPIVARWIYDYPTPHRSFCHTSFGKSSYKLIRKL